MHQNKIKIPVDEKQSRNRIGGGTERTGPKEAQSSRNSNGRGLVS